MSTEPEVLKNLPRVPRWEDLKPKDRTDLAVLRGLRDLQDQVLSATDNPAAQEDLTAQRSLVSQQIEALEADARKKLETKQKLKEKLDNDDKRDKLREFYLKFLTEHDIYYVASEHLYYEYFPDTGKWEEMVPQALHTHYSIRGPAHYGAFDDALSESGRKRMSVECSFFPKPDRVLNLMRTDHWLKPVEGEPSYAFRLLMLSLGNAKPENMDHIEQVVYWKYAHPEEYRLPCLVIYGEGGVGKNTFVKEVLGTLFGYHQVLVADAEKTLGQFNGLVHGKTVVMIDEAVADKVNAERLKRTVGNRTIDVNPKYGKQGEHDNTPLYLAGGNDTSGAILLAGDATDRRWSIIRVEKSIIQRLAEDKQITFDEALTEYDKLKGAYTDATEVSKWLNYLIQRWSHLEMPPVGLHQEDYSRLLETQKSPLEELLELVFGHEEFTHIEGGVLFTLYKDFLKEVNPAARGPMGRNKFFEQVRDYNRKNQTGILWEKVKITEPGHPTITTTYAFFKDTVRRTFKDNRSYYLAGEGEEPFWTRATTKPFIEVFINTKERCAPALLSSTPTDLESSGLEKMRKSGVLP